MNRREALRSMGVAAALPLTASELFALARSVHGALQDGGESERYLFRTLDALESEIVAAATELILPETDTPGARTAKVDQFIDALLTGWFSEEERLRFSRGVRELEDRAMRESGAGFASCEEAVRVRILEEMEEAALRELEDVEPTRRARRGALARPGAPFFTVLKWLTLYGYFTSEVGMERELEHVVFPGTYEGCMPLAPGSRE